VRHLKFKIERPEPLILWGLGPTGTAVTGRLVDTLAEKPVGRLEVFHSGDHGMPELKKALATMAEEAGGTLAGRAFELTVVAAAWELDWPTAGQELAEMGRVLTTFLPGCQALNLVLLLPPLTAGEEQLGLLLDSFGHLEGVLDELPVLASVFCYQLDTKQFEDLPGGGEAEKALHNLLARQNLDPDLLRLIRQTNDQMVSNRRLVDGKKAWFSTLGCHQIVYRPLELLAYLQSRFAWELHQAHWADRERILPDQLEGIAGDAEKVTRQARGNIDGFIVKPPSFQGAGSMAVVTSDDVPKVLEVVTERLQTCLDDLGEQIRDEAEFGEKQYQFYREAFLARLDGFPGKLAGGSVFLERIRGGMLPVPGGTEETSAVGLTYLEARCVVQDQVERIKQARSEKQPAAGEEPTPAQERRADALGVLEDYLSLTGAEPQPPLSQANRFRDWFRAEARGLGGNLDHLELEKENILEQLQEFESEFNWLHRNLTRRGPFRKEKQEFLKRLQKVDAEMAATRSEMASLLRDFQDLVNKIVLPQAGLRLLLAETWSGWRRLQQEYDRFLHDVSSSLLNDWVAGQSYEQADEFQYSTVLDEEVLDHYYRQTVGAIPDFPNQEIQLLALQPVDDEVPCHYRDNTTLAAHFDSGAASLLAQTRDHAEVLFRPCQVLDVWDLLEVRGERFAYDRLDNRTVRTRSQPELNPSLLPRVESQGIPGRQRVIKAHPEVLQKMNACSLEVLVANDDRVETDDRDLIELCTLTWGLPAFLFHLLNVERKGREDRKEEYPDLWPV
jgi:hypothetical protein